jgi:hypothetical protein
MVVGGVRFFGSQSRDPAAKLWRVMARLLWLPLVLALGCGAAGPHVTTPPATAARAWLDAEAHDDPKAAYELLASSVKKQVPFETFRREWQEAKIERKRQGDSLGAALREGVQHGERGKLLLGDGKSTQLVHEVNGWRLEAPLLSLARASTPQEALRLFASALEARSFDGVMRVLTSTRRDGLRQVIDGFVSGLKVHVGESVEVTGDRATLIWSDGRRRWKVTLKKEEGEWRVDDFNPQ